MGLPACCQTIADPGEIYFGLGHLDDFSQELSLASELVKNLAERADKDQNKEVSIEEILTFDDFEFIESALPVVLELGIPYNSVEYLVRLK